MSKQPPPAPTASAIGPCPNVIEIVVRPGKHHRTTPQLCRTGHGDVSHTRTTTFSCILSEVFPLDCLSCSALYFEYRQDYFHDTVRYCRKGRDNMSCIKNIAAFMFIPPVPLPLLCLHPPPPPPPPPKSLKK